MRRDNSRENFFRSGGRGGFARENLRRAGANAGPTADPAAARPPLPANRAPGTDVSIAFQDGGGNARSIKIPRRMPAASDRGYDADGNFVSPGTLKGYAIEAYKTGATSRDMETRYKLNRFDGETIELVVTALHRAGASASQPLR